MEIKRASEMGQGIRHEISDIFTEGFRQWLVYFSKDTKKLSAAFAHMFLLEYFYVAVIDGKVAGIAACTNGKSPSIRLEKKELRKHLGWVKGTIAYIVLRKELEDHPYPFHLQNDTGSVEFVATGTTYRSKGVATTIIRTIIETAPYRDYVLEVADTNTEAVKLYEKMGFANASVSKTCIPNKAESTHWFI